MDEFSAHLKTVTQITIGFLLLCFVTGLILWPAYGGYIMGLIVGVSVSLVNSLYLSYKIRQLTQAVITKSNRRINMGYITRASMSLLAIIASIKYESIEFSTTLAGLFFTQVLTFFIGIFQNLKRKQH